MTSRGEINLAGGIIFTALGLWFMLFNWFNAHVTADFQQSLFGRKHGESALRIGFILVGVVFLKDGIADLLRVIRG